MNKLRTSSRPADPTSVIDIGDDDIINETNAPTYDDVKGVLKSIGAFKTSKLDDVKFNLNLDKKTRKVVERLNKLVAITSGQLSPEQLMPICLQVVEDYIHVNDKLKCNAIKFDIVKSVMQPIMVCSDAVFIQIVALSCKTLKKSTVWRRNKILLRKFASFFLQML